MTNYNNLPREWYGYLNMGAIQIPPVPRFLILTDRADGTKWWLTYNSNTDYPDGFGDISITTAAPPGNQESVTFPANEEPILGYYRGVNRLMVRGGFLGVDITTPPHVTDQEGMQIYSRKAGLNIPMRHLILSSTTPGEYSWMPFTITQTPNPH